MKNASFINSGPVITIGGKVWDIEYDEQNILLMCGEETRLIRSSLMADAVEASRFVVDGGLDEPYFEHSMDERRAYIDHHLALEIRDNWHNAIIIEA